MLIILVVKLALKFEHMNSVGYHGIDQEHSLVRYHGIH